MKTIILSILILSLSILSSNAQSLQDCSNCSSRLITESQLNELTKEELRILKNEIYARKGYTFSSNDLKEHFGNYSWYNPIGDNSKVKLNTTETKNIALIDKVIAQGGANKGTSSNTLYSPSRKNEQVQLSDSEVARIFPKSVKKILGIKYNIYTAFSYSDNSGSYYLVLTENPYANSREDGCNDKIQAINFKKKGTTLVKTFEANDFIKKPIDAQEDNIRFLTNSFRFEDFDNDGLVEPIIIYGIRGINGWDDGWVKILIYRKNTKTRILIDNSTYDSGRSITVDKAFYSLPKSIQNAVIKQMDQLQEFNQCHYPYAWKESMAEENLEINFLSRMPRY